MKHTEAAVTYAATIAFVIVAIFLSVSATSFPRRDQWHKEIVPIPDFERRLEKLGNAPDDKLIDISAFVGMPELYQHTASEYIQSVFSAIKVAPITRKRFYHVDREGQHFCRYPCDANPVYDRDVVVPLSLLPRPEIVRSWSTSSKARLSGWRSEAEVAQHRGTAYGRTVIFEPGVRSEPPRSLPAAPARSDIPSWDVYAADGSILFKLRKTVDTPLYDVYPSKRLTHAADVLHLGERDGATRLGDLVTVPAFLKNYRLRWASIQYGSSARRFLAYSLVDGNGAIRRSRFHEPSGLSVLPYLRQLTCERHQPKIKQHDELLLPTPLGWPPVGFEHTYEDAHEEWCLDDWFPAQKDACWVIREAEDSKPLQESFLLMPASEESDRPVFFIALFAETEPKQLIKELAALYKVSPDSALNSPETMQRLNSLYEKVRDFPLDK